MNQADAQPASNLRPDARTRILAAASEIFLREGFAGASVDAVAASAHLSKLSIYELFPTKSALFDAAVRNACDMNYVGVPASVGEDGIDACLNHLGMSYFDRFIDPVNFGLFRANIVAANHFPALAADLHLHRMQASRAGADHLQTWADRGQLRVQDMLTASIRFGGLCIEGSRYFLGTPVPPVAERAASIRQVVTLFLDGYRAANSGIAPSWPRIDPPRPPMNVAVRMSPDRLEQLIAAATQEFLSKGYRGASVDRAVAVIRAGKATVYRQFGNKEGLFRHVIEQAIHKASMADYKGAIGGDSLEAETIALARHALDLHCDDDNIRMHRLLIQEADLIPDLARRFYETRVGRLGEALTAILAKYSEAAPDAAMVRAFYSLATNALRYLTVSTLPDVSQRHRDAEETARLFLHGARAPVVPLSG